MDDHELAALLAEGAGTLLGTLRELGTVTGRALGNVGDAMAHAYLAGALAEHRPDDAVLSEEAAADPARLRNDRVWIVDPLDGTREYAEGRADWAVHVCLAERGEPVAAAVALPAERRTYRTDRGEKFGPEPEGELTLLVSRTRPPAVAEAVADRLGARLTGMGSAGAKAMAVLRGEAHGYLHAGGQYEWDSAAPAGVCAAAGLHVSRIDGSPLRYNQRDPLLPDLLICRPELAGRLLAAIAESAGAGTC